MAAVISFIKDHMVIIAPAMIGVIDLIFAISPGLKSNGVLHFLYLQLGGKDS